LARGSRCFPIVRTILLFEEEEEVVMLQESSLIEFADLFINQTQHRHCSDQVFEQLMLPVPSLEPGDQT
jgi:hypothetical protein